jgi:hypothetical protein
MTGKLCNLVIGDLKRPGRVSSGLFRVGNDSHSPATAFNLVGISRRARD